MAHKLLLSLHLVAVISWMAGVLYLYRLLIYHREESEAVTKERFIVMERRLYKAITRPAMVVAAIAGISMIALDPKYYLHSTWLYLKLSAVLGLIASTMHAGATARRWAAGAPFTHASRYYRVMNEVPTLLMIAIVLLVVLKPF